MFEQKESRFDPESDGFYASVFPSGSEQPTGKRFLNASVIEAFSVVQQAEVALADAVSAWDMADAWSTDGALKCVGLVA